MNFVDETASDLRSLIERDFGPLPGEDDLSDRTVLDWMHYRARLIPRRPRLVQVSPQVAASVMAYPAILQIMAAFEAGRDVSPWLSDRVRLRRADHKADLMFNDWQISHFHLGNIIGPRDKIKRTRHLLFAHVRANRVVFLDVQPHGSWSKQQILRTLRDVSPKDMRELKGIMAPRSNSLTDERLFNLRSNGYSTPIMIDGKVFTAPGLGIANSRHATRLCVLNKQLKGTLFDLFESLTNNRLPNTLLAQLANTIGLPIRIGIRLDDGGCFVIYEKTRGLVFNTFKALE